MVEWLLREFVEVGSTQEVASRLGDEGAPEGTVVVSKRQTAGRGRHGRRWVSPEGGLYLSILLRPPPLDGLQSLALVASLAVARGIKSATGVEARIRWPNDVVISGKKVAGTIAESTYSGQRLSYSTVGIGVNCNSAVPSEDQWNLPTSLKEALGREVDVARLRESILREFGVLYEEWLEGADPVERSRGAIATLGKRVVVTTKSGETITGIAIDIGSTSGLVLMDGGRRATLHAEDIDHLREA